ncbi:hypothetical protein AMTR_s00013p00139760 [Amborella trichopoda]|uniref:Leucine-rich repeat-containing N-terminal plant-type domain-containing protein n=1 Tax=Amborella trichopoda TaxID=13333 RepID=W1PQ11_AMBTC|nr:hypothetical protein AMTR_s00013p00139760 [Amborella trichopoda]
MSGVACDASSNHLQSTSSSADTMNNNLKLLNLSNNLFNDSFHANFSRLKKLEVLDIYNNTLTSPLPLEVTEMEERRSLHSRGNFFLGTIPPGYRKWVSRIFSLET